MPEFFFDPFAAVQLLAGTAAAIQTLEMLQLRIFYSDQGIWRWSILRDEFSGMAGPVRLLASRIFSYGGFTGMLLLRLISALLLIAAASGAAVIGGFLQAAVTCYLLLSTVAIAVRWRGTFNGGSDYMTIVIYTGLAIQALFPQSETAALLCVYYIVIQLCSSYFIAGAVKVLSERWRDGTALPAFTAASSYGPFQPLQTVLKHKRTALFLAWSIMLFELAFPLAVLNLTLCRILLVCGFAFHLSNAWLFGLNRFLFIWTAGYPFVYWLALTGAGGRY